MTAMVTPAGDPGQRMALLRIGDWWEYDGQGSATRDGHSMPLRGHIRVSVDERIAGGQLRTAIVFMPQWRIDGVEGPAGLFPMPQGLFYFEQDTESRDVCIIGDNMGPAGADRFARVGQVFYPGSFGPDTAYDNVLDFAPHGQVANSLRTIGVETVSTALGEHVAWKAPIASVSELFGRVEGCDWWRPGLGAPLRFEMVASGPDGTRLATSAVLRATNRAIE